MRNHVFVIGLFLVSVALAACGGGGGGGGSTTGSLPVTPTSSPNFFLQRPAASGDQFSYSGTVTTSNVYSYPSPSPLPSTSTTAQVTQHINVTTSPNPFGGLTNPVDFHTVETDTYPLQTLITTSDAWFGYLQSGGIYELLEAGYNSADNNSPVADTFSYQYVSPQIIDEVPESSSLSWTNLPAVTIHETDADGTTAIRTIANDGTYTENQNQPNNQTARIVENGDGSGTYSGSYLFQGAIASIAYSAPSPAPTGSPIITVTLTFPTPTPPAPTTAPEVLRLTQWYQNSPKFYTETDTVTTSVPFPGNCNVPGTFGTSGNKIEQTINRLDTILGYTEQTVTDAYDVQGYGAVCITMNDTQHTYYDYSGDTRSSIAIGSSSIRTSTITEILTLQPNPTIQPQSFTRGGENGISPSALFAARAQFDAAVMNERICRAKALRTFVKTESAKQGVHAQ